MSFRARSLGRPPGCGHSLLLTLVFCSPCTEDDVDLEALVNDMDASLESLCAASETVPLLHNGQHSRGPVPRARVLQPQAAPRQRVQRSQPVSILAVRWAPASPRGPEGGWWGHCATLPPLRGQRVQIQA